MNRHIGLTEAEVASYARDAALVRPGLKNPGIVLLCEHGGLRIPGRWGKLGLADAFLDTHYAYDIGARDLTLEIAGRIDAAAVISNYSRLFLDYNRKGHDPSCMRMDMGGIPIPGNIDVSDEERALRERIARHPVEKAVSELLEGGRPEARAVISIHSFSPIWDNCRRSCEIGIMWKNDPRLPLPLIEAIRSCGRFSVQDNQPYSFVENDWFTLDRHGLSIGVPNAYVEVRSDLIADQASIQTMADVLEASIRRILHLVDGG